jgi:hypothetical protein
MKCAILFALFTSVSLAEQFPDLHPGRKLVAADNQTPTDVDLPNIWEEVLRTPFDGVTISFEGPKVAGRTDVGTRFLHAQPWDKAWFAEGAARIKALPRTRPIELFWKLNTNPGDVDWYDDAAWAIVVENGRIAAATAREAGLQGFVFDAEPYDKNFRPFEYSRQPQKATRSYADYAKQARKRGAELMKGWAAEFPSMTVLTYFMHSYTAQWARWLNPNPAGAPAAARGAALAQHSYGLLIPFIEGWLDALPPTMKLVDGCEQGYYPRTREEYLEYAHTMSRKALELVSPENHVKYKSQVSGGFGFFTDGSMVLPDDSNFSVPPPVGVSKVDWFRQRLSWALETSDEYVWVYGEKGRWWKDAKHPLWETLTPGITATLSEAKDFQGYTADQIAKRLTNAPNLLKPEDKAWGQYMQTHSGGTAKVENGVAMLRGCGDGSLWQTIVAKPGQRYFISAKAKWKGNGGPLLLLSWRDDAKALGQLPSLQCLPYGEPDAEGWRQLRGHAEVPAGATRATFAINATGQGSDSDTVEVKEPRLVAIPTTP